MAAGSSRGFAGKAESGPREPALPAIVPLAGTIDPGRYRLGPGDVMRLALFGPLSREATLAVTPEGTLFLADMGAVRSEEHTSELQSHSFISYAVFFLK